MLASSLAAASWFAANLYALGHSSFPTIRDYHPYHTTLICVVTSLLAAFSNLTMMRRVTSICIKRTWFHSAITPVSIGITVAMLPINYFVTYYHIDSVARTDVEWTQYELPWILLALNAVQAG
ncbi:hypothetical protein H9P43_005678 [Blastocladiella emersonii ATCC 22665]|nr:hypothetical protein H9P43_005678 [Blastocladiella emersonii ATCC 22665]